MKGSILASYSAVGTALAAATASSPDAGMVMLAAVMGSAASAAFSLRRERKKYYDEIDKITDTAETLVIQNFHKQKRGDMAIAIFLSVVLGMGFGFFGASLFSGLDPAKWYAGAFSSPPFTALAIATVASRVIEWLIDYGLIKIMKKRAGIDG